MSRAPSMEAASATTNPHLSATDENKTNSGASNHAAACELSEAERWYSQVYGDDDDDGGDDGVYVVRHADILAGGMVRAGKVSVRDASAIIASSATDETQLYGNAVIESRSAASQQQQQQPHTSTIAAPQHPHHQHFHPTPHHNPLAHQKTASEVTALGTNNRVCNSKYTWYSYLPKNLWEQFHRPINFYFLVVAFLQFIPSIAPVNPLSTVLPLTFAFMVTAVKEGLDDWRRHKQDDEDNNRPVTIVRRCWWVLDEASQVAGQTSKHNEEAALLPPGVFASHAARTDQPPPPSHSLQFLSDQIRTQVATGPKGSRCIHLSKEMHQEQQGRGGGSALFKRLWSVFKQRTPPEADQENDEQESRNFFGLHVVEQRPDDVNPPPSPKGDQRRRFVLESLLVVVRRQDIVAGDYVCVGANEEVPCDLVALVSGRHMDSSNIDAATSLDTLIASPPIGASPHQLSSSAAPSPPAVAALSSCYVSTENLDGESDSKPKQCILADLLSEYLACTQQLSSGSCHQGDLLACCSFLMSTARLRTAQLLCDPPNRDFRKWEGRMELLGADAARIAEAELLCQCAATNSSPSPPPLPLFTSSDSARGGISTPSTPLLVPCSIDNLLLSSSYLRPNEANFVIGMAVYVGNKTKVGCNARAPASKWADLDQRTNSYTKRIFLMQVVLTFISAVIGYHVLSRAESTYWYLGFDQRQRRGGGANPFNTTAAAPRNDPHHRPDGSYSAFFYCAVLPMRYFLMFTVMVPISFKVLVEMSKLWVMKSIVWDLSMTLATPVHRHHHHKSVSDTSNSDKATAPPLSEVQNGAAVTLPVPDAAAAVPSDQPPQEFTYQGALVNNSALAENLGQVQVVLTDKTGTLTNNEMNVRFVCCVASSASAPPSSSSPLSGTAHRDAETARLQIFEANATTTELLGGGAPHGDEASTDSSGSCESSLDLDLDHSAAFSASSTVAVAAGIDIGEDATARGRERRSRIRASHDKTTVTAAPLNSLFAPPKRRQKSTADRRNNNINTNEKGVPSPSSSMSLESKLEQHRVKLIEAMALCNMITPNNSNTEAAAAVGEERRGGNNGGEATTTPARVPDIHELWCSPSPDELALLDGARQAGVTPLTRSRTHCRLAFPQCDQTQHEQDTKCVVDYTYLARLDFTSERGLMSVLVRNQATNEIILLTKGSDERVMPLCSSSSVAARSSGGNNAAVDDGAATTSTTVSARDLVERKLQQYSREGLRTLVFAFRIVSEEEAQEWLADHNAASAITPAAVSASSRMSLPNSRRTPPSALSVSSHLVPVTPLKHQPPSPATPSRASSQSSPYRHQPPSTMTREAAVRASEKRLEQGLTLLGLTAVEDLLQVGVPRTIRALRAAGIKVWMLTGDKTETARQIATSCGLVSPAALDVTHKNATNTTLANNNNSSSKNRECKPELVLDLTYEASQSGPSSTSRTSTSSSAPTSSHTENAAFEQLLHKLRVATSAVSSGGSLQAEGPTMIKQQEGGEAATTAAAHQPGITMGKVGQFLKYYLLRGVIAYIPLTAYKWWNSQVAQEFREGSGCCCCGDGDEEKDENQQQQQQRRRKNADDDPHHHRIRHFGSAAEILQDALEEARAEALSGRITSPPSGFGKSGSGGGIVAQFRAGLRYDAQSEEITRNFHHQQHHHNHLPHEKSAVVAASSPGASFQKHELIFARTALEAEEEEGQFEDLYQRYALIHDDNGNPSHQKPHHPVATNTTTSPAQKTHKHTGSSSSQQFARSPFSEALLSPGVTTTPNSPVIGATTTTTAVGVPPLHSHPSCSQQRHTGGGGGGYTVCINGAMLDVLGLPDISGVEDQRQSAVDYVAGVLAGATPTMMFKKVRKYRRDRLRAQRLDAENKNTPSSPTAKVNINDLLAAEEVGDEEGVGGVRSADHFSENVAIHVGDSRGQYGRNSHGFSPPSSPTDNDGVNNKRVFAANDDIIIESEIDRDSVRREFTRLLLGANTVVCSRVTPAHKAKIVALVKREGLMTLSIGDGGNDVAMIQEAHVGVAILGKEGRQAAKASDFTLAQFRFLATLVLVHGHYAYHRSSFIVQYSFYKGMIIAVVQLLYNLQGTLFSGQTYWNSLSLTLYNGYFTVPLTLLYVMDIPLPAQALRRYPQLYAMSQSTRYMNAFSFFLFVVRGLLHGALIYFVCNAIFSAETITSSGETTGSTEVQWLPAYSTVLLVQIILVISESNSINWVQWFWYLGPVGAICSYPILFSLYSLLPRVTFHDVFPFVASYAVFYLGVFVATAIVVMGSWGVWMPFKYYFRPSLMQLQRRFLHHEAALLLAEAKENARHQQQQNKNAAVEDYGTSEEGSGAYRKHVNIAAGDDHERLYNDNHRDDVDAISDYDCARSLCTIGKRTPSGGSEGERDRFHHHTGVSPGSRNRHPLTTRQLARALDLGSGGMLASLKPKL